MSEFRDPTNEITGAASINGVPCVCIPQTRFDLMAACFYGGGPDFWALRGMQSPRVGAPQVSQVVEQDDDDEVPIVGLPMTNPVSVPNVGGRITPIGAALAETLREASLMDERRTGRSKTTNAS